MTSVRVTTFLVMPGLLGALAACDSGADSETGGLPGRDTPSAAATTNESSQPPGSAAKKGPPPASMRLAMVRGQPGGVATTGVTFVLTTFGSSSCPYRIEEVERNSHASIRIALSNGAGNRDCTDDLARHREQVVLPKGMRPGDVKFGVIVVESGTVVRLAVEDKTTL